MAAMKKIRGISCESVWDFEQEYLGGNLVDLLSNCLYPAERIAYRNDFFMIHKDGCAA